MINRTRGTAFTRDQYLANCRARARETEIFEQAYLCNPLGSATNHIVEWSAIERCRADYEVARVHLEQAEITARFGVYDVTRAENREQDIRYFIEREFHKLFTRRGPWRLGFDVAASGSGDLAVIYIDESDDKTLWLRGLFTCRTEDWHFLKTVLDTFLAGFRSVRAAGDASGLGRQICWEAAARHPGKFEAVSFSAKKSDLGFTLMNQLAVAEKRFPRSAQDVASDFFALRKAFKGNRWMFSEGANELNVASHCDIAWAGALATLAGSSERFECGAMS
jgi:phage FluMu gp28-like protein